MTVTKIKFQESPELIAEMKFFSQTDEGQKMYARFKTRDDITQFCRQSGDYRDLQQFVSRVPAGRVLDVGVGYGVTSAFLALQGYEVVAVEPSLRICQDMDRFFSSFDLNVSVINGTGESLHEIEGQFDAVVFCSSLHHCDDLPLALSNAYKKLKPGGTIFLFEPVLKFFRSKEWFYRMLVENPGKVGHYGGNEHIYRFGEYVNFLKAANFGEILAFPSLNYSHVPGRAPWDTPLRYAIKWSYYKFMKYGLISLRPIVQGLFSLSLINPVLFAKKK